MRNVYNIDIVKGRKAYQIFQLYGIDLPSKQLAKVVHNIDTKKTRNRLEAVTATEKKALNVCNKINKPVRTIRTWLEALTATKPFLYVTQ